MIEDQEFYKVGRLTARDFNIIWRIIQDPQKFFLFMLWRVYNLWAPWFHNIYIWRIKREKMVRKTKTLDYCQVIHYRRLLSWKYVFLFFLMRVSKKREIVFLHSLDEKLGGKFRTFYLLRWTNSGLSISTPFPNIPKLRPYPFKLESYYITMIFQLVKLAL